MARFAQTLPKLALHIAVQLPRASFRSHFCHNVVAIEDFSGLVTRDAHDDFFRRAARTRLRTAVRRTAPGSLTTANVEIISQRLAAQANRGDTEARVEHFCSDEQVVPFVFPGLCHAADWGLKDIALIRFVFFGKCEAARPRGPHQDSNSSSSNFDPSPVAQVTPLPAPTEEMIMCLAPKILALESKLASESLADLPTRSRE
jgi:hypothetical protein